MHYLHECTMCADESYCAARCVAVRCGAVLYCAWRIPCCTVLLTALDAHAVRCYPVLRYAVLMLFALQLLRSAQCCNAMCLAVRHIKCTVPHSDVI